MKNKIRSRTRADALILIKIPWIGGKVFMFPKLDRIDKIADYNFVVFCRRPCDQAFMPFMQKSHRRHKPDGKPLFTPVFYLLPYFFDQTCCSHIQLPPGIYHSLERFRISHKTSAACALSVSGSKKVRTFPSRHTIIILIATCTARLVRSRLHKNCISLLVCSGTILSGYRPLK